MNNPKVSVLMCVYNCEKYLREAMDSVLSQTFNDFEFIIINDGSTDNSKSILESYSDRRIRLFNNSNKGLTKSLNEGIGYSRGEYIARMDADDISFSERLKKQVDFLESNKDVAMCGTWAEFINTRGEYITDYKTPVSDSDILKELIFHNPFVHPSVMIRKEIFEKVGLYDENFRFAQDYELWTRIVTKYKTTNIPEKLLKYRLLKEGITKSKNFKVRILGLKIRWRALLRIIFQ